MTAVPGAREVREEDAFDVARVAEWLRTNDADPSGLESDPEVRQFSGGASNLTYLLRYPTRDLILRRAPRGTKAKGAHDMRREFTIQLALAPVFPYVAPMVGFCDDPEVLAAWKRVYAEPGKHWMLYELAEKLVDFEDYFRRWRFNHVTTVERIIGLKRGTGGTEGVAYLRRMLDVVLFPELWKVRTEL